MLGAPALDQLGGGLPHGVEQHRLGGKRQGDGSLVGAGASLGELHEQFVLPHSLELDAGVRVVQPRPGAPEGLVAVQLLLVYHGLLVVVDEEVRRAGEKMARSSVDPGGRFVRVHVHPVYLPQRVPDDEFRLQLTDA